MTLLCVSFSTASCSSWWNRFPCFHLDTTLLISLSIFSYPFSMHSVAVWLHLPDNLLSGTGMRLLGALQAGSSQSWMNPLPLSSENMCSSFSLFWWPSADLSPYLRSYCNLFLPGSPKLDEWVKPQGMPKEVKAERHSENFLHFWLSILPACFADFYMKLVIVPSGYDKLFFSGCQRDEWHVYT